MRKSGRSSGLKREELYKKLILLFAIIIVAISIGITIVQVKISSAQKKFNSDVAGIVNFCSKKATWRDCYGEQIGLVNKNIEFSDTLKILEEIKKLDRKTRDCHLIAHWISLSEVEKSPGDWMNIFDFVDQTTCNNGFVHGVLEGRSRTDPTFKINKEVITETCELIDQKTSKRLGVKEGGSDDACGHIMGHIMLAENNGNIPMSLDVCDSLQQSLRKSCFQGVFMENVTRENLEIHLVAKKLKFTEAEALELEENCKNFNEDQGESCWRELSHIFTILAKNEPVKSYKYCYSGENPEYNHECYMHAINLIVLSPKYSSTDLNNTCKPFWENDEALKTCINRTLSPLINSSVDFVDRAIDFCSFIPSRNGEFCYRRIGAIMKPKAPIEKRIDLCKKAPAQYIKLCSAQN